MLSAITSKIRDVNYPLVISLLALGISAFHFYFTDIRKYDDLKVTIISVAAYNIYGSALVADVIFTNNGNQQCSVTSVDIEQEDLDARGTALSGVMQGASLNESPFTLKSGDVVSMQFKAHETGKLGSGFLNRKKGERLEFRLTFAVVDSKGKYHEIKVPILNRLVGEEVFHSNIEFPYIVKLLPSPTQESAVLWPHYHGDKELTK